MRNGEEVIEDTGTIYNPRYCVEITYWHPANTRRNRLKAWLGIGEKSEKVTRSFRSLIEPLLIVDQLPKERFPE